MRAIVKITRAQRVRSKNRNFTHLLNSQAEFYYTDASDVTQGIKVGIPAKQMPAGAIGAFTVYYCQRSNLLRTSTINEKFTAY
jgi:hypothetical protein